MTSEDGALRRRQRGAKAAHNAIRTSGRLLCEEATAARRLYLRFCKYGHKPENCDCNPSERKHPDNPGRLPASYVAAKELAAQKGVPVLEFIKERTAP